MSFVLIRGTKVVLDTAKLKVSAVLVELPSVNPNVDVTNLPQSLGSIITYSGINPGRFEFDITVQENSASAAIAKAELISGALHPINGVQTLFMDPLSDAGSALTTGWKYNVVLNRSIEWKRDKELWPSVAGGVGVARLTTRVEFLSPDPHGYKYTTLSGSTNATVFSPRGNVPAHLQVEVVSAAATYTTSSPLKITISNSMGTFQCSLAGFSVTANQVIVLNFKDMEFYVKASSTATAKTFNLADRFTVFSVPTLPAGEYSTLTVTAATGSTYKATISERRI